MTPNDTQWRNVRQPPYVHLSSTVLSLLIICTTVIMVALCIADEIGLVWQ